VGLFFSLGHSTIVVTIGIGLTIAAKAVFGQVQAPNSLLHSFGGIFGTLISGCFLLLIATLNLIVLGGILGVFHEMRRGSFSEAELEAQLNNRGLMFRFLGPLMRTITHSWQMYPVGILFGLGFDTATEVALLAATAGAAATGLPWYAVLMLPILFTAGMSILDTADGAFMNLAYSWAFASPIRKVFYNIVVTGLSLAVALLIGLIELLGLLGTELNLSGGLWGFLGNFDINKAGFVIVGIFVLTWTVALSVWHFGKIETRWGRAVTS
ncbi:MAG: HoxN/HupN/NixA family nickel/cobalt transporter, partial [Candidatus Dormibacterales bacterium]